MFRLFKKSQKEKAGPYYGWGPAPNTSWKANELPPLPENKFNPTVEIQPRFVEPTTILLIGDPAEKAGRDCLMHLSGEDQFSLGNVNVLSVNVPINPAYIIPGQQFLNKRYQSNNPDGIDDYLVTGRTRDVLIVIKLGRREDSAYLLKKLPLLKQYFEKIMLFTMIPDTWTDGQLLEEMRELERFSLVFPHIIHNKDGTFGPIKNFRGDPETGQVINDIFYSNSSEWMMSEILYAWLNPDSRSSIDQVLINLATEKNEQAKRSGEPQLTLVSAASLYLPKAEHRAFLNAALGKAVLFGVDGKDGFFSKTSEKDLTTEFLQFRSNYYHAIYPWIISILSSAKPTEYPQIKDNEGRIYYSSFCKHLACFLQMCLQSKRFSLQSIIDMLSELLNKYQDASINTDNYQVELNDLLHQSSKKIHELIDNMQGWKDTILQKDDLIYGEEINDNLSFRFTENEKSSRRTLETLLSRQYSIPALDGDLARDPSLIESLQRRIEQDTLYKKFSWDVDYHEAKDIFSITLFLASKENWVPFNTSNILVGETFQETIDAILAIPISNMQSSYTEYQFLEAARRKIGGLKTTWVSAIGRDTDIGTSQSFIFSQNINLSQEFSHTIFNSSATNNNCASGYPPTRICALKIDAIVPLSRTNLFRQTFKQLRKDNCISTEEKLAMEIEKFCRYGENHKYLSLELIATLTDPFPVEVFFKALFSGLLERKEFIAKLGDPSNRQWVLRALGNYKEQYFSKGAEEDGLPALIKTYIDFVANRHYYGTQIDEDTSPFHENKWMDYLNQILIKANMKFNKKTLAKSRIHLSKLFGLSVNKKTPEEGFYFTPYAEQLKIDRRWLEHDFLALMHYFFEKFYGSMED